MPSAKAPTVYRVVVIRPKNEVLGGDPAVDDEAAKRYATFPTAIKVTKMSKKNFRTLKMRALKFFTKNKQHPVQYTVEERWSFPTFKEAQDKLLYEAKGCGHFVEWGQGTWIRTASD